MFSFILSNYMAFYCKWSIERVKKPLFYPFSKVSSQGFAAVKELYAESLKPCVGLEDPVVERWKQTIILLDNLKEFYHKELLHEPG